MRRVDSSIAAMLLLLSTAMGRAFAQEQAAVRGVVRDLHGIPQLGALVELLGPGSSVLAHTYTDDHGRYLLAAPQPGSYQLRTSAAFLLPVLRRNLRVVPGGKTLANVTMSALFEVGDWFPVERRGKTEPADDWRWTLRSSAERPLLRLAGSLEIEHSMEDEQSGGADEAKTDVASSLPAVSDFESGGEQGSSSVRQHQELNFLSGSSGVTGDGLQQSWRAERETVRGGILSVRTSVGGHSEGEGAPAISLSMGYQQGNSFTHSQYRVVAGFSSLPEVVGIGGAGYQAATLATGERIVLGDLVTIDAGTLLSAERLVSSRVSTAPFLRLLVHPAGDLAVMYRYAGSREAQSLDDLDAVPMRRTPLSDAQGRPIGRAASHQELALSRSTDFDVATLAVYRDAFAAGAVEGGGATSADGFANMPVLANRGSGQFVVALDGYTAQGVSASWTHSFSADLKATLEADFGTTLAVQGSKVTTLRSLQESIAGCSRPALTADVVGQVPKTATTFEVRYHWQPRYTMTVINAFNAASDEAYASVLLKQRLWRGRKLRSVSAVLEASNLLEEGYQPVIGPDGETLFLAQVPRRVQAGLTFSF